MAIGNILDKYDDGGDILGAVSNYVVRKAVNYGRWVAEHKRELAIGGLCGLVVGCATPQKQAVQKDQTAAADSVRAELYKEFDEELLPRILDRIQNTLVDIHTMDLYSKLFNEGHAEIDVYFDNDGDWSLESLADCERRKVEAVGNAIVLYHKERGKAPKLVLVGHSYLGEEEIDHTMLEEAEIDSIMASDAKLLGISVEELRAQELAGSRAIAVRDAVEGVFRPHHVLVSDVEGPDYYNTKIGQEATFAGNRKVTIRLEVK